MKILEDFIRESGRIDDPFEHIVLTKVSDWNTVRKNWEFMRRKFAKMNDDE